MPHELREFGPVVRYLEQCPDQNLMLLRSLRLGPRPGFAAIVDDPEDVRAILLIDRPDWKSPGPKLTRIQVDAAEARAALQLLSWLPTTARLAVHSYRPWLQELLRTMVHSERLSYKVHCLARPRQFRPNLRQSQVVEFTPEQPELRRQAEAMGSLVGRDRFFGIFEDGELVACAALTQPDTDYVAIRGVYTREEARQRGYGSAVLSAATQAGLDSGKTVSYSLSTEDVSTLRLVAGLGFMPTCREWVVEGYVRR